MRDFTKITQASNRYRCTVRMRAPKYDWKDWLIAGITDLRRVTEDVEEWHLEAKLRDNATDGEHDPAHAFRIPLIGVRFIGVWYGWTRFNAFIGGDKESLRVPPASYNPFLGAQKCTHCKGEDKHVFAQYLPDFDDQLWNEIWGNPVQISMGLHED